jgi:hypothetical protein
MATATGNPGPGEKNAEYIVSLSDQYTEGTLFERVHYYCLILTDRRVICVNTDALIRARKKEVIDQKAGEKTSFLETVLQVFERTDTHFSDHFRQMHPSDIVAAHPDANIIPLTSLFSLVVTQGLVLICSAEDAFDCWDTTITGRNKRILLKTLEYPTSILENEDLKDLLGHRFHPPAPPPDLWRMIFGGKNET